MCMYKNDLVLNNQYLLICRKTKQNQTLPPQTTMSTYKC